MMDFAPKVEVKRFARLVSGDLFIYETENGTCVALKAMDKQDGDEFMVLLGPNLPNRCTPGLIVDRRDVTVVSFGKNYFLRLPANAKGWSIEEPGNDKLSLVIRDGSVYLRANCTIRDGAFEPCLVELENGTISYGWRPAIQAFATTWEIATEMDPTLAGQIFSVP